jgi:hypothetical protein
MEKGRMVAVLTPPDIQRLFIVAEADDTRAIQMVKRREGLEANETARVCAVLSDKTMTELAEKHGFNGIYMQWI